MRLAAVATNDELTRDFLLQSVGEEEEKAAVALSETCWGEDFDPLGCRQSPPADQIGTEKSATI